jgi:hypothetical protein
MENLTNQLFLSQKGFNWGKTNISDVLSFSKSKPFSEFNITVSETACRDQKVCMGSGKTDEV